MIEVPLNHTSERALIKLHNTSDGLPSTGIAYTAVSISRFIVGTGLADINPDGALSANSDAFNASKWFQVDATKHPGVYTFDVPNTVWAALGVVVITVRGTGLRAYDVSYKVVPAGYVKAQSSMPVGTVTDAVFTPTTTQFRVSESLSAQDDLFNDRMVLFTSGTLKDSAKKITDYDGTNKHFTVEAFPVAPSNGDTFIIV